MSAFVVTHKHIEAIVNFANRNCYGGETIKTKQGELSLSVYDHLQKIAEILYAENIRSVNARYPDTVKNPSNMPGLVGEVGQPISFSMRGKLYSAVEIIKACECLEYQSCETDDYEQTDAYKITQRIIKMAINKLPGYDAAEWSID